MKEGLATKERTRSLIVTCKLPTLEPLAVQERTGALNFIVTLTQPVSEATVPERLDTTKMAYLPSSTEILLIPWL